MRGACDAATHSFHLQQGRQPVTQSQEALAHTFFTRSVEQLTDNVDLAISAKSICVVWIGGMPQLIVYLPHANKFILHSRPTPNDRSGKTR